MKKRVILLLKSMGILLAVCIVYFILYTTMGIGIVCPINRLTGLLCPLCGVSRMFASLLKFDFESALYFNAAFLLLIPFWLIVFTAYSYEYVQNGRTKAPKWHKIILYTSFAIMLAFGIIRNVINVGLCPTNSIFINCFWGGNYV